MMELKINTIVASQAAVGTGVAETGFEAEPEALAVGFVFVVPAGEGGEGESAFGRRRDVNGTVVVHTLWLLPSLPPQNRSPSPVITDSDVNNGAVVEGEGVIVIANQPSNLHQIIWIMALESFNDVADTEGGVGVGGGHNGVFNLFCTHAKTSN